MPDEPDLGPLFDQFAAGAAMAAPIPDLAEVLARTRRRHTSRWAIAAAASVGVNIFLILSLSRKCPLSVTPE
jgi:hypothetical protein